MSEVKANTEQMIAAAPFLGPMAADPSLRGIMTSLKTALAGVSHGQAKLEDLQRPIEGFGDTLAKIAAGQTSYLSWRSLITGVPATPQETRRFIEVQPRLDFGALEPGASATDAIRAAAASLHLTPDNGVRVRLTGPVPLSDEEFATLADRAALMGAAMMAGGAGDAVAGGALVPDHRLHPGDAVRRPRHHHGARSLRRRMSSTSSPSPSSRCSSAWASISASSSACATAMSATPKTSCATR